MLDAAGNAMVIFTDGIDAEVTEDGRTAFDVLRRGAQGEHPRVLHPHRRPPGAAAQAISDEAWAAAVARTGGKFYNARRRSGDRPRGQRDRSHGARPRRDEALHAPSSRGLRRLR